MDDVTRYARLVHEEWRHEQQHTPGAEPTPQWRATTDGAWSATHGGAAQVNLSATPFAELPADWQAALYADALTALGIVEEMYYHFDGDREFDELSDTAMENATAEIHRRCRAYADPTTPLDYEQCSIEEQAHVRWRASCAFDFLDRPEPSHDGLGWD